VPDAASGGVEDGVGDGWRDADDGELANALAAERADVRVVFFDEGDVDGRGVGMGRDEVLVKAGVEQSRGVLIGGAGFSRAWPMPMTAPPRIWFAAVLRFRMRPAPQAPLIRSTRTSPRSGSTVTTANQAPNDHEEVSARTAREIRPPERPIPEGGSHWLNPSRVVSCRRSRTSP
jgi:hypothetical protein